MTTNQTIDGVPRKLRPLLAMILNALDRDATDGKAARGEMASELRALLDAPAKLDLVECDACPTSGGCVSVCMKAPKPAAQPQGEHVGFRYRANGGPWELMAESPFADGRTHHNEGGEQLEPVYAKKPQGEPVAWQYRIVEDGKPLFNPLKKDGWIDTVEGVAKDMAERPSLSESRHYEVRKLYAEQHAPVAVVLPDNLLSHRAAWLDAMDRLVELEPISHEPDSDDKGFWEHERKAMHDMYACLDELKRPARANPPAGTDPSGTHHDNDGLDDYRNTK